LVLYPRRLDAKLDRLTEARRNEVSFRAFPPSRSNSSAAGSISLTHWHLSNSGVYNLLPAREQGAKMDGPDRVEYAFLSVAVLSFFGFVAGVVAMAIF
jgi:hypothetical protein